MDRTNASDGDGGNGNNIGIYFGWILTIVGGQLVSTFGLAFLGMLVMGVIILIGGYIGKVQSGPKGPVWNTVGAIASLIENPDYSPPVMHSPQRGTSRQAQMDAEFHGDNIQEFRGDNIQEFRGDNVSNWTEHDDPTNAPEGFPSAVPKDFHQPDRFWHNPEEQFSDPFA